MVSTGKMMMRLYGGEEMPTGRLVDVSRRSSDAGSRGPG